MLNLTYNGTTIKSVIAGSQFSLPNGDVVSPAYAGWESGGYSLTNTDGDTPKDPTPEEILTNERQGMTLSFAQLLIGLVSNGWISEEDGRGWLRGILPQRVEALISTLSEGSQFAATARATVPSQAYRLDPLVVLLAKSQGKTDEDLDEFFRSYAK